VSDQHTVSILGCGWLGNALADALRTHHTVRCLGRDQTNDAKQGYYRCDTLVIGIPPREGHLQSIQIAIEQIEPDVQLIFLSSTSYYDNKPAVIEAETLVRTLWPKTAILRLGGLMGYDRIAGRYTAGQTLPHDAISRYIHRDDAVGIIAAMIEQNVRSVTWNALAPIQHPKSRIFEENAKRFGFEPTRFENTNLHKRTTINADALIKALRYRFVYPDANAWYV
jgi:nucleoside-diphosphate-sugar epimerase